MVEFVNQPGSVSSLSHRVGQNPDAAAGGWGAPSSTNFGLRRSARGPGWYWSESQMARTLAATTAVFCDRDLFFHDGSKLRRIRLSRQFQAFLFVILLALVGWSGYATARMM